jgi:hypothetical protein
MLVDAGGFKPLLKLSLSKLHAQALDRDAERRELQSIYLIAELN